MRHPGACTLPWSRGVRRKGGQRRCTSATAYEEGEEPPWPPDMLSWPLQGGTSHRSTLPNLFYGLPWESTHCCASLIGYAESLTITNHTMKNMPVKVVVMRKVMMTITSDYDDKNIFFVQYLNKQTTALREVNDSRLRIYEQVFFYIDFIAFIQNYWHTSSLSII